jgi:signal transduction histidine kinase
MPATSHGSPDKGTNQALKDTLPAARVGHVFLDVRERRLHCLNETARQLHADGVPLTPEDASLARLRTPAGDPVAAAELPLLVAWRQEQPTEARFLLTRETGPAWQVAWTASPLRNTRGRLVGILGTVRCGPPEPDARKMAELAHDLRTPLQSIRLLCAMLERHPQVDAELTKTLEAIRTAGDRAVQIALDLLEHCRGPARKGGKEEAGWFALDSFLTALAREQNVIAQSKGLVLATDFDAVRGWEIRTDRVRLGRALANLLVNAIRYTTLGRVLLAASWRDDPEGRMLVLCVTDTGPGISQEEQESIFQPFERGRAGRESDSGGSGLGLAVVDRLAEELGLDIEVYSEFGRGSTFHLLVPASMLRPAK